MEQNEKSGFALLSGIRDDLIEESETVSKPKKTGLSRFLRAAAAACVCLAVFAGGFLLYARMKPKHPASGEYFSVSKIRGAEPSGLPKGPEPNDAGDICPPDEYVKMLKDKRLAIGTLKNIETVRVDHDGYTYYVSTFDLEIIESVCNLDGVRTVRAITVATYYDSVPYPEWRFGKSGYGLENKTEGLYWITEAEDDTMTIGETEYRIGDFADYRLVSYHTCDGETFNYYGTDVSLDDLRTGNGSGTAETE